jgi:CDP-paratose synthetase
MRILITGGTGYLGKSFINKINALGWDVVYLLREGSQKSFDGACYDFSSGGVDRLLNKEKSFDVVFHAATCYGRDNESVSEVNKININLPLMLLEKISSAYPITFINIDTKLNSNVNLYSYTKRTFAEYIKFLNIANLRFLNLRLEHFFGPGAPQSNFITFLIRCFMRGDKSLSLTDGDQARDFIYIDDVISCLVFLINASKKNLLNYSYLTLEVGSGEAIRIKDIVILIKELCLSNTKLDFGALPYRENESMLSKANIDPLKAMGWKPAINLVDGLKFTIKYERKL